MEKALGLELTLMMVVDQRRIMQMKKAYFKALREGAKSDCLYFTISALRASELMVLTALQHGERITLCDVPVILDKTQRENFILQKCGKSCAKSVRKKKKGA